MDPATLIDQGTTRLEAGKAASDDGRPAAAARELRAGLRLVERSLWVDRADVAELRARLLISLGWAESERGRVDTGFRLLDEAEPLLGGLPPDTRAILLAQRGLMLMRAGRLDLALTEYDAAVGLLDEAAQPLDLVRALNNRSLVHLEAGRVAAARADLRRCALIADRHGLRLHAALSEVNLGCLDVLAGDLPAALRAFTDARAVYQQLAPGRLPALAVERARALLAAGLFTAADRELAFAVEHADDQRLSYTHADALLARAEAALLANHPTAAAEWAGQARARFRGRHNARRGALAALLELRAVRPADPAEERALAVRALALATRLHRLELPEDGRVATLVAVRSLVRGGRVTRAAQVMTGAAAPGRLDRLDTRLLWRLAGAELAAARGHAGLARRHRYAGMASLHRYRRRFGSLDLQTGASVHGQDLARAGLEAALATGSVSSVFRWAERARAQALLIPPVRGPAHPAASAALADLRQARHLLRTAELAGQSVAGLGARVAALERAMQEESWSEPGGLRSDVPSEPVPLGVVRSALGRAAMVCYLRDGSRLRAVVVTEDGARLADLGPYAAAAEAATRLRADLDTQAGRILPARLAAAIQGATVHDAEILGALVLDPLLSLVGDRELVVVPTGSLFTAPWSVLPACRDRAVTVSPSASAWHAARLWLAGSAASMVGGRVLLVAGPGTRRGEAEVAAIGRIHPGAKVLTGELATAAATLAGLVDVDIAHLAAHGRHQTESALFSSLDLAGGPLFGYDLRQAPTPPMVVLSCCDLGRSDVRPGDETLGMAAALLGNGTATVIASVARVGDDLAMEVMTHFHRAIATGCGAAAALARACAAHEASGFICFGSG
jgi:tetratricopeptide (TPR) repeat protein